MKLLTLISVLLAICGCRPNPDLITPSESPAWLLEATELSVKFWAEHGFDFEIGPEGLPIKVEEVRDSAWGQYELLPNNHIGISELASELLPINQSCIVSHELGHFKGMEHIETDEPSLMFQFLSICSDDDGNPKCCWSDDDQAEFDRVWNEASP
jgi:hypothetical protein